MSNCAMPVVVAIVTVFPDTSVQLDPSFELCNLNTFEVEAAAVKVC